MKFHSPREAVCLTGYGVYLPKHYLTAQDISHYSGIPADVIQFKMGLNRKHRAHPDEHVSDMAVKAGLAALGDIDPEQVDALIYFGSEYKDYYVWSVATHIQHRLRLKNAFAFEIMSLCASFGVAMKVAKDMLLADQTLKTVLLVMAAKEGDLLDYQNHRSRFMFNFGDGAAACLLKRNALSNEVLGCAILTDGSFSLDVYVPAGGSRYRPSEETIRQKSHFLDVADIENMKRNLDPVSLPNFIRVIAKACQISGLTVADIDLIGLTHMKPSMHQAIIGALGLAQENAIYLENHGHIQAGDQLIALREAEQKGLLTDGKIVVLAGAGTGYTWSATCIRWGNVAQRSNGRCQT